MAFRPHLALQARLRPRPVPFAHTPAPPAPEPAWRMSRFDIPKAGPKKKAPHELRELWGTPDVQIATPDNPIAKPSLATVGSTRDLHEANRFFMATPPEFLYSAVSWRSHEVNYYVPEVCVLGCSNAGKSTFINALLAQKHLARSSSEPGSTRAMNAFACGPVVKRQVAKNKNVKGGGKMDLQRGLILMDTPGYGFNSVREWGQQIEEYLQRRTMLKGVVLLLRADIALTNWDVEVLRFLAGLKKRTTIILTRTDRCGEGVWPRTAIERYEQIATVLRGHAGTSRYAGLEDGEWTPGICLTAAGMRHGGQLRPGKMKGVPEKDAAGMGGARIAVLRLAGLIGKEKEEAERNAAPEWHGQTVGWDDIPVKGE